jgi:hypothetical protein
MNRNRPFDNHSGEQNRQEDSNFNDRRYNSNERFVDNSYGRDRDLPRYNPGGSGGGGNYGRDRDYTTDSYPLDNTLRGGGNFGGAHDYARGSGYGGSHVSGGGGDFGSPSDYGAGGGGGHYTGGYYGSSGSYGPGSDYRGGHSDAGGGNYNDASGNFNTGPLPGFDDTSEGSYHSRTGYRSAYTQGRFDYDATYQDDRNSNNYRQGSYGDLAHRSRYANHNQGGGGFFGGPTYDPSEAAFGSDERNYPTDNEGISESRNWISKAADQVLSWAGNQEADRRRRLDRFTGDTYYSTESSNRLDFD